LSENIEEQTRQVMDNIKAILEAAGSNIEDVVQCQVILRNMNDYAKMNTVYGTHVKKTHQLAYVGKQGTH